MLRAAKSVKRTPSLSLAFVKLISTAIEYISSERTFNRHFLYYKMEIFFFQIHPLRALTVQYPFFLRWFFESTFKHFAQTRLDLESPPFSILPPVRGNHSSNVLRIFQHLFLERIFVDRRIDIPVSYSPRYRIPRRFSADVQLVTCWSYDVCSNTGNKNIFDVSGRAGPGPVFSLASSLFPSPCLTHDSSR